MTETYQGPWSSVRGDQPQTRRSEDPYHPRYPDAGVYQKVEDLSEQPAVNTGKLVAVGISGAQVT